MHPPSSPMLTVTPEELLASPGMHIVDVRSTEERLGELGYIPGSVSIPEPALSLKRLRRQAADQEGIAVVCLSGRRSALVVEGYAKADGLGLVSLEGGVLGWRAAGQPLCGVQPVSSGELEPLTRLSDFQGAVLSCFAAESVEAQLNAGAQEVVDPAPFVDAIFSRAHDANVSELLLCLDELARVARMQGHSLGRIADNVDRLRESLLLVAPA